MDLVAKTNFTLDNLSQNLNTIKNELSPFVNQLEVVKRTIGTSQTKHELEIGNLLFSGDSPLIWYKQCFSQINSRLEGSIDSYYKLKKIQLKIEKLVSKESLTPKQNLKLNKLQTDYVRLEGYIQNAISEMQHYKNVASKMKQSFDIPDNITDSDMDQASMEDHIKTSFRQAIQDVSQHGVITRGTFGHLEQWGVHPMTAKLYVFQYLKSCEDLIEQNKTPNINHLHQFLEEMYQLHKDCYKDNKTRLGI